MTTIVCGTDFSDAAADAAAVAASLARRAGALLVLVHVGDAEDAREKLERVGSSLDVPLETVLVTGSPADRLVDAAATASLLVVGAVGHRKGTHWLLGSTAECVAERASVPLLVVRRSQSLLDVITQTRRGRVMIGTDLTPEAEKVLCWFATWRKIIPSDVHLSYVADPPVEYARLGISGPIDRDKAHPVMENVLMRQLREEARKLGGDEAEIGFSLTLGLTSKELVRVAGAEDADLLVVGAHQRGSLRRVWQESVARGVLHRAQTNVAVIPLATAHASDELPSALRR